jgi:hypothetical protein
MLLLAASLGLLLLAARSGHLALPRTLAVDLHAVLGLWGWGFGVLLCVASLAMPMLQGTPRWPPRALSLLLALLGSCLLASVWLHAQSRPFWGLPIALPPPACTCGSSGARAGAATCRCGRPLQAPV